MRTFSLLASVSLFALALATPSKRQSTSSCMSQADAQQVADNFQNLIADYSDDLANKALAVNFTDYSDSVITLIDSGCVAPIPLGAATFTDRASFEAGQGSQPPIPFQQLNLWYSCTEVFLRWRSSGPGQEPESVTGNIILETVASTDASTYPWLIDVVYSEFNSGAWLVNLGVFVPNCTTS